MDATPARRPAVPATTTVLGLLCAMYFINYIVRVNVSTAAAVFQPELHLTNTQVGLIFAAFAYPYLAFQVAGGWVADKFGARRALTVFAIIWSAATVLMGLANSLSGMVLGRILVGIGVSALPVATRAMSNWTRPEKRGWPGAKHERHDQSPDREREPRAPAARSGRSAEGRRTGEGHRGREWRPGGGHRDPRDRFKVPRDVRRKRFSARVRRNAAPPKPPRKKKDEE